MATTNNYYKIKHGLEAPSQDAIQVTESTRPTIRPSLSLDFANSKVLDPRITFARASTATYYDGQTVSLAEQNLVTYSQEIDNAAWDKYKVAVTANTIVAPDGNVTGEDVVVTSADVQCTVGKIETLAAVVSTFSCYIKAGLASWVCLGSNQFAADFGWFNVSTGVVGSRSGVVTASEIRAVGNGWYLSLIHI